MPREDKKKVTNINNIDEDVEKTFDQLWDNWSSRRRCESSHPSKFKDRKKKGK